MGGKGGGKGEGEERGRRERMCVRRVHVRMVMGGRMSVWWWVGDMRSEGSIHYMSITFGPHIFRS